MPGIGRSLRVPGTMLVLVAGCAAPPVNRAPPHRAGDLFLFAVGDPQINIGKWGTAGTDSTVVLMNGLPGQLYPFGGHVGEPAGVLVIGDLIDDLRNDADWEHYRALFDPEGKARLRYPAYEGLGNHDVDVRRHPPGRFSAHQQEFIARNRRRPGDFVFDEHGYHYSWQWGGVRFIQLNLFPGTEPRPVYDSPAEGNDPQGSLGFLRRVLREQVGTSGQPVVVAWHYGLRGWGLEKWWTPADLDSLASVLDGYNVILLLHGHEHRYERYLWHGYDVIMAPAPQLDRDEQQPNAVSQPKGFLVFRITRDQLQLAHRTAAGWQETWSTPLRPARGS